MRCAPLLRLKRLCDAVHASARERAEGHDERGDTLVEILIAIVILSVGVIGVYSTLLTSIVAVDGATGRSDVVQLVTWVTDAIERAPWECRADVEKNYEELLDPLKPRPSWTISVTSVQHWSDERAFVDGCPADDADATFRTLKLTVLVAAPGTRAQRSIEIVKRP
jgi:prepilin-type N-terminal cleavage/methylation domain-containing protein